MVLPDALEPEPLPTRESHLVRSARYLEIDRLDLADRAVHDGLRDHPDDADLHAQLAAVRLRQHRHDETQAAARHALGLDPEHRAATFILGWSLTLGGRHSEAERVLLEGLRRDPDDPDLLRAYGMLLHRVGVWDKSERVLRRSLELQPEDETAHQVLALVLNEKGRHAEAAAHGARALAHAPDESLSHFALALAEFHRGHPLRARALLREAVRLDPGATMAESYAEIDKLTRWPGLPLYWWSILLQRVPGKQFTVWIAAIVSLRLLRSAGAPVGLVAALGLAYLALVLYTWLATPLLNRWVRWFPAR